MREQIASTVAQRDALKQAIETSSRPAREGLLELIELDRILSRLDTQFKTLWDASRA